MSDTTRHAVGDKVRKRSGYIIPAGTAGTVLSIRDAWSTGGPYQEVVVDTGREHVTDRAGAWDPAGREAAS